MDLKSFDQAPRDWIWMPLCEACDRITSGGTPSRAVPEYFSDGGIPWVKTKELLDRVIGDTEEHITELGLARSAAKLLPAETILMAMYASPTVGRLGLLGREMACNQACCALIAAPGRTDSRFLFYQLLFARNELQSMASGSAQQNLSARTIGSLRVPLPPIDEQRAIASVLGALDDKIELNRRMNETLEALARAIFTSWFVDFDPVRAKAEGRQPVGMDAETAALFPDSFEDSLLGPIPSGWQVVSFGEIARNERIGVDPSEVEPSMPYVGLDDMPRGSIAVSDWGSIREVTSAKSTFQRGDVLFGKLRPYFHKVGIAPVDGVCSTDILVLRGSNPRYAMLVLLVASSEAFVQLAHRTSSGTRMPRAKWLDLARHPVFMPPAQTLGAFNRLVGPMIERLVTGIHESQSLSELRDALLPKLVSGQIRPHFIDG